MNPVFRTYTHYVTANVLGMLGLSFYILADTFFVARGIGTDGLAALNLAIPIYSFVHGLGLMIGIGGATRYALLKDKKRTVDTVFTQALLFSLGASVIIFILGSLFSSQLSKLLGANAAVYEMTSTYLKVILFFAPMFMLNNVIIAFVRNDKNPKLAMLAMLIGSFSNVILDYIFVFPCEMGMFGAALATGMAPMISLLVLSSHFLQKKNTVKLTKASLKITDIKEISSLGVSALMTELSSGIVMIVFNTIILRLQGNLGVAAYGIIANLALVVIAIFTGIAQGIQPIISINVGLNQQESIKKTYGYAIGTALILAVVIIAVAYYFAIPLVHLFNNEQALTEIALKGLTLYFIGFVFVGINSIKITYFSAINHPKQAFVLSLLRGFVLIIPMALLLSTLFGITGVWLAFPITEFLTMVIGFYWSDPITKQMFKKEPSI